MRCVLLVGQVLVAVAAFAIDHVDWVDTRYGSDPGLGTCVIGPCLPHGSSHPSPDSVWPAPNRPHPPPNGFYREDPVDGFSQLHAQGTGGRPSYGLFLLRPFHLGETNCQSHLEIREARPYRFSGHLVESGIDVKIAPSAHGSVYEFTSVDGRSLAVGYDVRRKIGDPMASSDASMQRRGRIVEGGGTYSGNWNEAPYKCFFHAEEETRDRTLVVRIAVSFSDVGTARKWFAEELSGMSVADLSVVARKAWNEKLSTVIVPDATADERRRFYSNFFHAFVQPRDRTGDFAEWPSIAPFWDDHYTLWDTWKTLFPLMTLVDPKFVVSNVNAFAARMRQMGECDTCMTQGKPFRTGQGGDEADNIIAEAIAKDLPGIDTEGAWHVLSRHAAIRTRGYRELGWVPFGETEGYCHRMKSASSTLAFAYNDWCAAQTAQKLGKDDDVRRLLARSANWTNVWDKTLVDGTSGYVGFCRGRYRDGRFTNVSARAGDGAYFGPNDSRNYHGDFYEGTCWEYSYNVWHDLPALIAKMGGREKFVARLSYAFENGLINYGNEPSFMTPWLFDFVGRPDLASRWAHAFLRRFTDDGCPGDDDSGAMGSMYVFLTCGLYPIAGQDVYALHAPAVREVVLRFPQSRRTLRIVSELPLEGTSFGAVFLNGMRLEKPLVRHADLLKGGLLEFRAK